MLTDCGTPFVTRTQYSKVMQCAIHLCKLSPKQPQAIYAHYATNAGPINHADSKFCVHSSGASKASVDVRLCGGVGLRSYSNYIGTGSLYMLRRIGAHVLRAYFR